MAIDPQYLVFTVAPAVDAATRATSAVAYRPAPMFDFARGDFVRDGTGRIVTANGHVAWAQRQIKRVLTRRRSSPLYRPDFGTALDLDIQGASRSLREAAIIADVRSQLEADPATLSATQFAFLYTDRRVFVNMHLRPTEGSPVDVGFPGLYSQA
jgi:hypothetical protein